MPILDLGYREHRISPRGRFADWLNWVPIATHGIRLVYRGTWLRRTLVLTLIPALVCAAAIFILEQLDSETQQRFVSVQIESMMTSGDPINPEMMREIADPNQEYDRALAWRILLANLFRVPQSFVMLLLVGLIAPRLISFDYRSRGYLLYFSRPVGVAGYLLGKQLVVWFFLSLVTTASALFVYVLGLAVSPDLSVFWDTYDLPLRIIAASVVLIVPTTLVALFMSSLTVESRYAAFGWFALWTLGWVTYTTLTLASLQFVDDGSTTQLQMGDSSWFTLFSPYHTLGRIQYWVFGVSAMNRYIAVSIGVVVAVTIACYVALSLRLHRQLRS